MSTQHQTSVNTTPDVIRANPSSPDTASKLNEAATIAYYKAASRYFAPGKELDDWLAAVSEINKSEERRP